MTILLASRIAEGALRRQRYIQIPHGQSVRIPNNCCLREHLFGYATASGLDSER